jgi:hypothetical protein
MFRGSLIMAAFSFGHHGIKDGDHLYVVRPTSPIKSASSQPLRRSDTRPWTRGLLRGGNALLMEASRLSDLAAHMQCDPTGMPEPSDRVGFQRPWRTVLDPMHRPDEPSTEPLPICWR